MLTLFGSPYSARSIGEDFNASGYPGVLKSSLEGLKVIEARSSSSYNMAQIHALARGRQPRRSPRSSSEDHDRDSNLTYVKVEPAFDDFRSDPRFQKKRCAPVRIAAVNVRYLQGPWSCRPSPETACALAPEVRSPPKFNRSREGGRSYGASSRDQRNPSG